MVLSPSRLFLRVLITIWAAVAATAQAGPVHYTLELPAEQRLAFRVEFEVAFPGTVTVDADWSPGRVLVFRLERPGRPALRRSGPPPMHMELDVAQGELDRDDPWTLVINGLPTREAAGGRLLLGLPDAPSTHASEPDAGPQSPAAHTEPWMLPVTIPSGLEPGYRRMLETTETFRELVVDEATPDAYGWQEGMLRFLAERRERAAAETTVSRSTHVAFRRIVEAVDRLEALRLSESQPLSGPPPTDPLARRAWSAVRDPRFEPVELELGSLLDELHRGHVPQLENERWFSSFLSCMIVCQRHFEEQARLGAERAGKAEFVRSQWGRVLAAARALDALTDYVDRPGGVDAATSSPSRHPSRR
jgi:hypothetical protein